MKCQSPFSEKSKKKLVTIFFRENRCFPIVNFQGCFTAVTLKIRSRSPKSNLFFVMSQFYIQENSVRIQLLVHKILCIQESLIQMPMPTPKGSAPKSMCPPPRRLGDINIINLSFDEIAQRLVKVKLIQHY